MHRGYKFGLVEVQKLGDFARFKSALLQHSSHAAVKKYELIFFQKLIKAFFFIQYVHLLPFLR